MADRPLELSDEELAAGLKARGLEFGPETVAVGLAIFEELGALTQRMAGKPPPDSSGSAASGQAGTENSPLFCEVGQELLAFEDYLTLAWSQDLAALLAGINRPILP